MRYGQPPHRMLRMKPWELAFDCLVLGEAIETVKDRIAAQTAKGIVIPTIVVGTMG